MTWHDDVAGLAPEIAEFSHARLVRPSAGAKHSLLRPETVESLFVMWRVTGDAMYREWGWHIFEAINSRAKVATGGFAPVKDVTASTLTLSGTMDTWSPPPAPAPTTYDRTAHDDDVAPYR